MIPCLRYADPKAAIRFLTEASGFVETMVVEGPDGGIIDAELAHGEGGTRGMVMVGGNRPFFDMRLPKDARGVTG